MNSLIYKAIPETSIINNNETKQFNTFYGESLVNTFYNDDTISNFEFR